MATVKAIAEGFIFRMKIDRLPVNVERIAHRCGYQVMTYRRAMGLIRTMGLTNQLNAEGFTALIPGRKPLILVRDDLSKGRRRAVIAHELGHLELHFGGENSIGTILGTPSDEEQRQLQEAQADEFAQYILAPLPVLYALDIHRIEDIQRRADVDAKSAKEIYYRLNRYSEALADRQAQAAGEEQLQHNFRGQIRRHDWHIYALLALVLLLGAAVISGATALVTIHLLDDDPQPAASQTIVMAPEPSMPELSSTVQSSEVTSSEPSEPEEPEISQPEAPAASAPSTAPKEPTRSGGEIKTQDRVIYYQAPVQQTPTQQAPAAQEAPQETEPAYTPPAESSKSEPVYSQPPKVVQDDGNTYYWTAGGSVYHSDPSCYHIRGKAQASGILQDALDAGKKRLCYDCPKK